jgi:glycosyltransferase involved in cell wall biosynthesis
MGTHDILDAGLGALVADEDEHKFAIKVIKLLNNEILRKRLAVEGKQYAQSWSADSMAFRMLKLYRTLCDTSEALSGQALLQSQCSNSGTD